MSQRFGFAGSEQRVVSMSLIASVVGRWIVNRRRASWQTGRGSGGFRPGPGGGTGPQFCSSLPPSPSFVATHDFCKDNTNILFFALPNF